jgi:hypothetical protein
VRILQRRIDAAAEDRFLTDLEIETSQNSLLRIITTWNQNIRKQVIAFYNAYAEIGRILDPHSPLVSRNGQLHPYNPLKLVVENRKRFLDSDKVLNNTMQLANSRLLGETDLYAVFYSFISSIEGMEYVLHKPFEYALKKYSLESKYDPKSIFSVTRKRRKKNGEYETDARMIRNALAHFDYNLTIKNDSFTISFESDFLDPNDNMILTDIEFFKYVMNFKFLLQSFFAILSTMSAFSSIRYYFANASGSQLK